MNLIKKVIVLTLIISFSFSLTSCKGGITPSENEGAIRAAHSGTQGIELQILSNFPPPKIYDTTDLTILAEVWNKGSHDLEPGTCFLELGGYSPSIIKGIFPNHRQSCVIKGNLEGKKSYNLEGSYNQLEFRSSNIQLDEEVYDYSINLNLHACYQYHSVASPLVCVENSQQYNSIDPQHKACLPTNVGVSGGQGAPVGVSFVNVNMAGSRAIFEITVNNYGSGVVLSPQSSLNSCPNNLNYNDYDEVGYSVELSGGSPIICSPSNGLVRLNNNQGKIQCQFDIGNAPAYETPLIIHLDYNYLQSIKKPITILKTPGYE